MNAHTLDSVIQILIELCTLAGTILAIVKATEAKSKAAEVSTKADANHVETVSKLDTVVEQTNGVLSALPVAIKQNQSTIAAVVSDVEALKNAADHGHNP